MGWILFEAPENRVWQVLIAGLSALIGSVLGGRIGYLAVNWGYFQSNLEELFQLPLGGYSWPGALIGALLGSAAAAFFLHLPIRSLSDHLFPLFGATILAVWMGCWLDGCAYGQPTSGWFSVPAVDEWGNLTLRWPLQATGGILTLLTLILFDRLRLAILRPGGAASLGWIGLTAQLWWTSTLRADPGPIWNGIRMDTWGAILFFIFFIFFAVLTLLRKNPDGQL